MGVWRTVAVVAALCVLASAFERNFGIDRTKLKDLDRKLSQLRRFRDAKLAHAHEPHQEAPVFVPQPLPKKEELQPHELANGCPAGWTGPTCDSAICNNETAPFMTHDGMNDALGDTIEMDVGGKCEERFTFPVDYTMPMDIYVAVDSVLGGRPYTRLYDPKGTEIPACGDMLINDDQTLQKYCSVHESYGEGIYTIQLFSDKESPCGFEVTAPTFLYPDGGFVLSPQDDVVQMQMPKPNEAITSVPVEGTPYFFAFKLTHDVFPVSPQIIHIYTNGRWEQNFSLRSRYRCATPHLTTSSFNCTEMNYYHMKFQGVDENGNLWQRLYLFDCDYPLPTGSPVYPTGTPPVYTECYNEGVLNQNGSCYCGPFFEGPQCELKVCMNGGELDFRDHICVCKAGYSGDNCQHVNCPHPHWDAYDLRSRSLAFVIRSSQSMQAQMDQIVAAAVNITAAFSTYHPGYFQSFILSVVQNNAVLFTHEFQKYSEFITAIRSMTHPPTDTDCDDALLLGISEVMEQPAFIKYPKSPIFIFSDGTANDPTDVRYELITRLSNYRGQLFFMLSDSVTGRCNVQLNDLGYMQMRQLAAFSQGQVVKVALNDIGPAATALAESTYMMNELITNDLEDCRKAPRYNSFFIDESTEYLVISATGAKLSVLVTAPNRTVVKPQLWYQGGNLYLWVIDQPVQGNYLVSVSTLSADKTICQYRVSARSSYDLFVAVAQSINSDVTAPQPVWREPSHLVAHVNHVYHPDIYAMHAEIIVTTNGASGSRDLVYASSGLYRDSCFYELYFGSFTCKVPDMMFYVQVYVTDSIGNTILRTSTGICMGSIPTPVPSDGCANGGVRVNGTCICPPHYTGAQCQQIVCEHSGTALHGACVCPAGYTGQFCESANCYAYNDFFDFNMHSKSLSVLIHDSISTRSVFRTLNESATRVVDDIRYTHHKWITHFQIVRFNDSDFSAVTDSPDPNDFIRGMNALSQRNYANSDYSCKDLNLLPALYSTLTSMDISFGGIIYIFVNGLPKMDTQLLSRIYNHLESTETTIHVIQTSTSPCGQDLYSAPSTLLMGLSELTAGRFTLTMANKAGDVFRSLPTLYSSQLVTENYLTDCTKPTTFYIPVDSLTQSLDVVIAGDLVSDPVYISPDGGKYNVVNLWNDIGYGARGDQIIQPCDQGWDQYDNRCFKFGLERVSWTDAAAICHQEGASLASIFNQGDQAFLSYQAGDAIDYWTGLNDIVKTGEYVWDSPFNLSLTLESTGYTNWASGQPVFDKQKTCVMDSQSGTIANKGWNVMGCDAKLSYVCQKHVYNQWFEPRDPSSDFLPRGIWKLQVQTDEGGCSAQVTAQSRLRIYARYTPDIHDDFGYQEPFQGTDNNRIIAHVTGLLPTTKYSLEYAHFYQNNLTIIEAETVQHREKCLFEFISSPFECPMPTFQMMLSGVDDYGYLYQRIIPVSCLGGPTPYDCENGAAYFKGECVCPPGFYGEFCQVADCQNGGQVQGNLNTCGCPAGFTGRFCEIPVCTRGGNKPDKDNEHRTMAILLDGAQNGDFKQLLDKFSDVFAGVIQATQKEYPTWFTNYVGVVFRDVNASQNVGQLSPIITNSDPTQFATSLTGALTPYMASSSGRSIFSAIVAALSSPLVKPRSTAFIVTAGIPDDSDSIDLAMDAIAKTHTQVNLLVLGDQFTPGNASFQVLDPLFATIHMSGGAVYLLHDTDSFSKSWQQLMLTLHSSYYVMSSFRSNCSNYDEYIQNGANASAIVVDLFSAKAPHLSVTDPKGKSITPATTLTTNTNTINVFAAVNNPGIFTLGLDDDMTNGEWCMVNIRGKSTLEVLVAFTQDVAEDGGLHSNDAYNYPQAGFEQNAVVAAATGGVLQYVQLYDVEERRLRFASPLIVRSRCDYSYISQNAFYCDRHSFAVAIDGMDFEGHPFRRMFTIHCIGFIPPRPTGSFPPMTRMTEVPVTTKPLPVYPSCPSTQPKIDLILAFDSSLTMNHDDYISILDKFYLLGSSVTFDKDHTRVVMGTYDNMVHFEQQDFNNTINVSVYLTRLVELMWSGYTGNDGNNVKAILDYIIRTEVNVTPFRTDARKMILYVSSQGWDKGNYYDGQDHGFDDPTADGTALHNIGVEFFPIGYGSKANFAQLQALSSKCARQAFNDWDLEDAINYFYSTLCSPTPVC